MPKRPASDLDTFCLEPIDTDVPSARVAILAPATNNSDQSTHIVIRDPRLNFT
jgi:hypothetical protein